MVTVIFTPEHIGWNSEILSTCGTAVCLTQTVCMSAFYEHNQVACLPCAEIGFIYLAMHITCSSVQNCTGLFFLHVVPRIPVFVFKFALVPDNLSTVF